MSGRLFLGTSGWTAEVWETSYPTGTRPSDHLSVWAQSFKTVECGATFYPNRPPDGSTISGGDPTVHCPQPFC